MDFLDNQMIRLMKFLRRLRDAGLRLSATAHVTDHAADCPHCDERTRWAVRMLLGYVRCRQCGRDPMTNGEADQVEQLRQTALEPESYVST